MDWDDDVQLATHDLSVLQKILLKDDTPDDELHSILLKLCSYVQTDTHLSVPSIGRYTSRMWHAAISLDCIMYIVAGLRTGSRGHWNRTVETLTNSWLDILRWVDYLKSRCRRGIKMRTGLFSKARIFDTLVNLLEQCLGKEASPLRNAIPDGFPLICQLWLLQAEEPHLNGTTASPSRPMYDRLLSNPQSNPTEDVLRWTGATLEEIAAAALIRLRRRLRGVPAGADDLDLDISILSMLENIYMQQALLSRNSIVIVTRSFARIAHGPTPTMSDAKAGCISQLCGVTICRTLNAIGAPSWVSRVLEAGLLLALLKCSPWFPEGMLPYQAAVLLGSTLPPYLIYISVVRSIGREMKKVAEMGLEANMKKTGALWEAWTTFKALVTKRMQVAGENIHGRCGNIKCNRIDSEDNFRRCGGCLRAMYCSRDCQSLDWKAGGHRVVCKDVQRIRQDRTVAQVSDEDLTFASVFATQDVFQSCNLDIVADYWRTHKPQEPALLVDYTKMPRTITISKRSVKFACKDRREHATVHVKLPCGKFPVQTHFIISPPMDDAEGGDAIKRLIQGMKTEQKRLRGLL